MLQSMAPVSFKRLFDLATLPSDWTPERIALDWSGLPLLLLVEGKPPRPDPSAISEDPWVYTRWYQTPPKAHHLIYFDGTIRTICFEQSKGLSTSHIQRFDDGWLLGDIRGGRAVLYDSFGRIRTSLNLGDASEDLQTTAEGQIWVSYFDEGVFGGGVGRQGLVCFDGAGVPVFQYGDFADNNGLPPIYDCYALNVAGNNDVWLNYHNEFPLVHLHDFALEQVWPNFGEMSNSFALRQGAAYFMRFTISETVREAHLMSRVLQSEEAMGFLAVDESGKSLVPLPDPHLGFVGRGSHMLLNTGEALYQSTGQSAEPNECR
jgi:hypothetical protein